MSDLLSEFIAWMATKMPGAVFQECDGLTLMVSIPIAQSDGTVKHRTFASDFESALKDRVEFEDRFLRIYNAVDKSADLLYKKAVELPVKTP